MERYGIVVEGSYDVGVYKEFIMKINPKAQDISVRVADGRHQLMKKFPSLLKSFEHLMQGAPLDKALVIRDADCQDPTAIAAKMQVSISRRSFTFPGGVNFHAVKQEMETWLLADLSAINRVAVSRGGKQVARVPDSLEEIVNPKEKFMTVLSDSGLNYTQEVCREIAKETDLKILRMRCPSFTAFEEKVLDP